MVYVFSCGDESFIDDVRTETRSGRFHERVCRGTDVVRLYRTRSFENVVVCIWARATRFRVRNERKGRASSPCADDQAMPSEKAADRPLQKSACVHVRFFGRVRRDEQLRNDLTDA